MPEFYLGVHCHYYQPPRGNPFGMQAPVEAGVAPFANWNARIAAECYGPNAAIGNFRHLSFNVSDGLMQWLLENAPDVYEALIQADVANIEQFGAGNAIAQPFDHTVLPLSRREDKLTQVRWGKAVFEHRFGRSPSAMWLPEMAVDYETLEVLLEEGIEWTILTEAQVTGKPVGSGPYWIRLPNQKRIKVFIREEELSNDIAFSLGRFGGAGRWARQVLVPRKRDAGLLTLIATDGETFGHHWPGEEQFLHWLLTYEARAAGYETVTLERYARLIDPVVEIGLNENTSWSCVHGLARWATGCNCTSGDSTWKGALRRAMDNLRYEIDRVFENALAELDPAASPLDLRNSYIDVTIGRTTPEAFLKSAVNAPAESASALIKLIEAQICRQSMYNSSAFFPPDLDALSTQSAIANAASAIKLTREATSIDLGPVFRRDLSIAIGPDRETGDPITGADLYDQIVRELNM